jgi:hypothetical protein
MGVMQYHRLYSESGQILQDRASGQTNLTSRRIQRPQFLNKLVEQRLSLRRQLLGSATHSELLTGRCDKLKQNGSTTDKPNR